MTLAVDLAAAINKYSKDSLVINLAYGIEIVLGAPRETMMGFYPRIEGLLTKAATLEKRKKKS